MINVINIFLSSQVQQEETDEQNFTSQTAIISALAIGALIGIAQYVLTKSSHEQSSRNQIQPLALEHSAAILIQKTIRGHLARKAHLPGNLFSQYRAQCEKMANPKAGQSTPMASGGKTPVYLPPEMPEIVLKYSKRTAAITRFHQMQLVRSVLVSQNSSHLTVPKANLYQDFLVEERLPIDVDDYHNMRLYVSQPELFNEAVCELTRLFSKIYLSDLVNRQKHPLGHISGVEDFVRYDNLPLYIVEENGKKEGKIGLIDLEHIHDLSSPVSGWMAKILKKWGWINDQYPVLETLARIFPWHLSLIKKEAEKLDMQIDEVSLQTAAEKGKKYLQVGFIDHLEWIKQKSSSIQEASSQLPQISPERMAALTMLVEKELLKLNQGINDLFGRKGYIDQPAQNFLTENPEELAKELATNITPLIIRNLTIQIESFRNDYFSDKEITESKLVSLRSPVIKVPTLYEGVASLMQRNPKIKFKYNGFCSEEKETAEQLAFIVMTELVKGAELFYFDPAHYSGHEICWIRY